jgi:hypothetical protein
MEITNTEFETLVESLESTLKVLRNVDYDIDSTDPKNVEKTSPYAIGFSRASILSILQTLETIKGTN